MKETKYLIELIDKFISNELSAEMFAEKFENYMDINEDNILAENEAVYDLLAEIKDVIAYYESDEKLRIEGNYKGEKELKEIVKKNLHKLEELESRAA